MREPVLGWLVVLEVGLAVVVAALGRSELHLLAAGPPKVGLEPRERAQERFLGPRGLFVSLLVLRVLLRLVARLAAAE